MATMFWGNVYYKDSQVKKGEQGYYVGKLQEEPGNRYSFTYDPSYIQAGHPAIAYNLPLRQEPHISEYSLHPFFDNLVAEGWLAKAQARALGVDPNNRFALLLGFGHDLAGAVSIIDPKPQKIHLEDFDETTKIILQGHASLSGIQRKLLAVKEDGKYRPVKPHELSTHFIKLTSNILPDLIELEYLSTLAAKKLLPHDQIVEMEINFIPAIKEHGLIITRFDRNQSGK